MLEMLKKYWFIFLAGIVLVAGIVYFAYDQSQDILPGKQVDGKDVVYAIGDHNVTADDFYDELYEELGVMGIFQFVQRVVLENSVETTEEMKEAATANVDAVTEQFKSSYGADYEAALVEAIKQVGYNEISDLDAYFLEIEKFNVFSKSVVDEQFDSYSTTIQPRMLSHILVMMEDPANPTEEELAKVAEVDAALSSGMSFGEAATTYSEDGSATSAGFLGYADVNTGFVPEFLAASLVLEEGQVSEWVQTEYGVHLIQCNASTLDTLKEYTEFYDGVTASMPTLLTQALWDEAVALGITFSDETTEAAILEYLGLGGTE